MRLVILALAALALGFVWGAASLKYKIFPYAYARSALRYESPLGEARLEYFATHTGHAETVFVGDSIFRSIEWAEEFPGADLRNRAADGQTTDSVLARIDRLKAINADTYIIMIGTNDLGQGRSADYIARRVARIVAALPGRKLVMEVPPCAPRYYGCNNARNAEVNARLRDVAQFVPIPAFDPRKDLADKVHPDASGMKAIVDAVRPFVGEGQLP